MLGSDVAAAADTAGWRLVTSDRQGEVDVQCDLTDATGVSRMLEDTQPTAVIHCAAWTDVDRAEADPEGASQGNVAATRTLAAECGVRGVGMLMISTDFVFDGKLDRPYTETDEPNPLGVYGRTKLQAEAELASHCDMWWVVRTAWLYGLHGRCFPDTMIKAAEAGRPLRVVADQIGCPTYTPDLAETLLWIVENAPFGLYHAVNSGEASWYTFASEALRLWGLDPGIVTPISSAEWPTPTRRPANSRLSCARLASVGGPALRNWREALEEYIHHRRRAV